MYTEYGSWHGTFGKPTALRIGWPALLPISAALFQVIRQPNLLKTVHRTDCDATRSLVLLNQLTCVDRSALVTSNLVGESLVYYSLGTGVASTVPLPQVPYRTPRIINSTRDSRPADDYLRLLVLSLDPPRRQKIVRASSWLRNSNFSCRIRLFFIFTCSTGHCSLMYCRSPSWNVFTDTCGHNCHHCCVFRYPCPILRCMTFYC